MNVMSEPDISPFNDPVQSWKSDGNPVPPEELVSQARQNLAKCLARRDDLLSELASVDEEIARLQGLDGSDGRAPRRDRRLSNPMSLKQHVLLILKANPPGYNIHELTEKVLAAGYVTGSNNFRNVLYQCLYNMREVYHDSKSGTYRIRDSV